MTELKREYVVPLRRKVSLAPKWRRSKKAVFVLKEFIQKHMKTDNVVILAELNDKIWENGIKNPPGKVSVVALKTQFGGVEKTLVNLLEVGVDKYLEAYKLKGAEVEEQEKEAKEVAKPAAKETKEVKETKEEVKNE